MERLLLVIAGAVLGVVAAFVVARMIDRRRPDGRRNRSISQLAHDLRTPLSSIMAYSEILNEDDGIEPAERSRFLGIIHEEASRMEEMIETRLEAGTRGDDRREVGSASHGQRTEPGRTNSIPGRTILVVDDDRFLVDATRTLLTREGFLALGALSGQEALTQARERRPDLILMDRGMPGMTGEQTLAHLRNDAVTREIPVIITTGDEGVPPIAGAEAVLTKPVTREKLLAAIETAVLSARPANLLGGNHA